MPSQIHIRRLITRESVMAEPFNSSNCNNQLELRDRLLVCVSLDMGAAGGTRMTEVGRAQTMRALNDLLDSILNTDHAFSAKFIFEAFQDILPNDIDFEIVLRERRRFFQKPRDFQQAYLNFAYLSFAWRSGRLERLDHLGFDAMDAFVAELEASPDRRVVENQKVVCFLPDSADEKSREIVELTGRCLGAFYHTCGSYDHFITNVTNRFVHTYFLKHRRFEVGEIVREIEEECKVRVAYLDALGGSEGLTQAEADPTGVFPILQQDERFRDDLRHSLKGRSATQGVTADGFSYSIQTLAHEYFDHGRTKVETGSMPRSNERVFTYAPRAIVITAVKDHHLTLDVLSFTARIFRAYLADLIFSAREDFFSRLLRDGGRLADRLLVAPAETAKQLQDELYPLLGSACEVLKELTFARSVAIRAFNPFDNTLKLVASSQRGDISAPCPVANVPVGHIELFASARAYAQQASEGLELPGWLGPGSEPVAPPPSDDFGEATGHVASLPIKVGAVVLGTLDFFATDRKFFANDSQYLALASDAVGELIRRVEAANDAAWLSRLSFLHSARHRLEKFKRQVAKADDKLGEELAEIIKLYSSLDHTLKELDPEGFRQNLRSLLVHHEVPDEQADGFLSKIEAVFTDRVPSLSFLLFQELLENLLRNAREHDHVRLGDITLTNLGPPGEAPSTLMVHYKAEETRRGQQILSRLCVSPISDGDTYHYGLFLLSTQLRMAGGYASGHSTHDRPSAEPFQVAFGIPLTDSIGA